MNLTESIAYDSGNHEGPPELRLLHYNDVYHVAAGSQEPVGGLARFATLCREYQQSSRDDESPGALTLFSGDAFNPSLESSVTKGAHMVPALHAAGTRAACLGNHDLDFGVAQFRYLADKCDFPWLCANVLDPHLGENVALAGCGRTHILTADNGIKVGLIGLVEREWLDTIRSLPKGLEYRSASATASELAPRLRGQGADIVICLTHQREPNDHKLASKLPQGTVDLILGGHDHYYGHSIVNGTLVLRSGSDFRQLSYLEGRRKRNAWGKTTGWDFNVMRRDVVSSIPEDPETAATVEKLTAALAPKLAKPVGYTAAPLDGRFTTVRRGESNLANFVCDIMRFHYEADCCLMAAGTVRGDLIYPPGVLRVKDLMDCFPFEDPCVVVRMTGKDIVAALENGVSKYPALEGRFPQVSGIKFSFDPAAPPNQRCGDVLIGGTTVDLERKYTVATRDYMVSGHDGFSSMLLEELGGPAESVVSEEGGLLISTLLRQYFMSIKILGRWKNWHHGLDKHWNGVHEDLHDVHPVREPVSVDGIEQNGGLCTKPNPDCEACEEDRRSCEACQRQKRRKIATAIASHESSDNDEDDDHHDGVHSHAEHARQARELHVMRQVTRKWWRLSGLPGHPNLCEVEGDEFGVNWTRAICPRVEGRIIRLGSANGADTTVSV